MPDDNISYTHGGEAIAMKSPTKEAPISAASGRLSDALEDVEMSLDLLVRGIESVLGPMGPEAPADPMKSGSLEQSSMAHFLDEKAAKLRWIAICMRDVRDRVEL